MLSMGFSGSDHEWHALERAMKAVMVEKRQAVLNVHTFYSDDAALADARR